MRLFFVLLLLGACADEDATETNVTPAPCDGAEDCAPDMVCAPLEGAIASDGSVPMFCRAED